MSETIYAPPSQSQTVEILTYPVKSLPGVLRMDGAQITDNGLDKDRIFTLAGTATSENGLAPRLTLREHPMLTQITTGYADQGVTLTAEGMDTLVLPYGVDEGKAVAVKSWGGAVTGLHISTEADEWLGSFLARDDVQILAVPDSNRRVLADNERDSRATQYTGRATDGYPLHIVSLASLRQLNEVRAKSGLVAIGIERFRANIVIDGLNLSPFAEDYLPGMRFKDDTDVVDTIAIKACVRCMAIEAGRVTGQTQGDVLKSLSSLQSDRTPSAKLVFGVWAAPSLLSVGGIIRAGQLLKSLPVR